MENIVAHYVTKAAILEGSLNNKPVYSICGEKWSSIKDTDVTRNICEDCEDLKENFENVEEV